MAPASENAGYTRYQDIPETSAELDWADLVTLDLSEFDRPGGKERLAAQLTHAIHNVGFFYLINFGLSEQDVDRQFEVAAEVMRLPEEEKAKYAQDFSLPGGPLGFQLRSKGGGYKSNMEIYDDPKWNKLFEDRPRPTPCVENREQSERFYRHLHDHVLYRLLVLTAIILELDDEEQLWRLHDYEAMSNCHIRYMLQHPSDGVSERVPGHTDNGTFTLLFRQPIAGLQVKNEDTGSWKYVKPYPNSITVNVADTLSTLTGGYLKSSIHRVLPPPDDQKGQARLGVLYFSRASKKRLVNPVKRVADPSLFYADDDTLLRPLTSPVILKTGIHSYIPPDTNLTVGEWVMAKHKAVREDGRSKAKTQVVNGVTVPTYA